MYMSILVICIAYRILRSLIFSSSEKFDKFFKNKSCGLIIAHPDDETMFFSPWIRTFLRSSNADRLFVLCLSNGNYDGLGTIREKEIIQATTCLGMKKENVSVIRDSRLADGPKSVWKEETIRAHVTKFVETNKISTLITFDDYGISGHINHVHCSKGVRCTAPGAVSVWILRSTQSNSSSYLEYFFGLVHKYTGPLGILLDDLFSCLNTSKSSISLTNFEPLIVWNAMASHQSQFVWYRRLFVIFSHFAYTNTVTLSLDRTATTATSSAQ